MKAYQTAAHLIPLGLSVILLLLLSSTIFPQTTMPPEVKPPLTDQPVEYNIGGKEKHHYKFKLKAKEFFQVRVEQKNVDVSLRLLDGSESEVAQMNFPRRNDVREILSFVVVKEGSYTLEVVMAAAQDKRGVYAIRRTAARKATTEDARRAEIERLFMEAMLERAQGAQVEATLKKTAQVLAGWRELGDSYMEDLTAWKIKQIRAVTIFREAQTTASKNQAELLLAAREKFIESGRMFREIGEKWAELGAILGAALISQRLGDIKAALEFQKQALPIFATFPDLRENEALVLVEMATGSIKLGDKYAAIEYFKRALEIYRALPKAEDAASTENDIGALYYEVRDKEQALNYLNQALEHREKLGDVCKMRATLSNIGLVYSLFGEKAEALKFLHRALPPPDSTDNRCQSERASALTNIGMIYNDLGEHHRALKEYLEISIELPETKTNKSLAAATHNNIGTAHYALGNHQEALKSFELALSFYRALSDEKNAATALSNIGVVHTVRGENQLAINRFDESLKSRRNIGDKIGEAITLNNLGEVYFALGDQPSALEKFNQALPLFRAAGDRNGEAVALSNEMAVWSLLGKRRLAIFYGKQAVNLFQELRGAVRGLENEIQKNYLRSVKNSYRLLAELLIEEGLYAQAAQTLNFYQDEQFFDFNLDAKPKVQKTALSSQEESLFNRYEAESRALGQIGAQFEELERKLSYRLPTDVETAELLKLQARLKTAEEAFSTVLKDAEKELAQAPVEQDRKDESVESISLLQKALGQVKQKTVALYTLVGRDKLYILLLKPGGIEAFSHPTDAGNLNRKISVFFKTLEDRRFTGAALLTPSAALYNIIFLSTSTRDKNRVLARELEKYRPDILLWSLEGNLRYIPVAALYDSTTKQYLVEKYQNVVFTRAEPKRFLLDSKSWDGGIAFGKSTDSQVFCQPPPSSASQPLDKEKAQPLSAMPAVAQDLPVIANILKGRALLNGKFNRQSFIDNLTQTEHPLVHISSHFCFQAGDTKASFLLLGDDQKFSLFDMKDYLNLFGGVDLLVLSACQTAALQSETETGKEIDSLAELSQRLGARSVIATLWNADAVGSGKLMLEIYRLHKQRPELSKAELLRQAQLSFLRGKISAAQNIDHPYFWAPFVLYGSFK